MIVKECFVSTNGISCFKHTYNIININYHTEIFIYYLMIRASEFIISDFINNKNLIDDNLLLPIMFS